MARHSRVSLISAAERHPPTDRARRLLRGFRGLPLAAPRTNAEPPSDRLLDRLMPSFDVRDAHTRRIAASPAHVYAALVGLTARDLPLLGALMGIRTLPSRLTRRRARPVERDRPLLQTMTAGSFTVLAEEPEREIVVGTIGHFWRLRAGAFHQPGDAADFLTFTTPGYAKAAMTFHLQPQGGETILTTETRVLATDPASRRAFRRYWRVVYFGSALIRWAWLRAIDRAARRAADGKPSVPTTAPREPRPQR